MASVLVGVLAAGAVACGDRSSQQVESPLPGAWRMVFADEFDGDALADTWQVCRADMPSTACGADDGTRQHFAADAVTLAGGMLHLTARVDATAPDTVHVLGGRMSSQEAGATGDTAGFEFTYGYLETRVRLPAALGARPSVRLDSSPLPGIPEGALPRIDVVDWHAAHPTRLTSQVRRRVDGEWRAKRVEAYGTDRTARWVVVGVDWRPTRVTFAVDGRVTGWVSDPALVPDSPMHVVVDLAVEASEADPDPRQFPATVLVDYVRVWQHYGQESR